MTSAAIAREARRRLRVWDLRVGSELRRLRLDAGVTLALLARAVGVDPTHLGRIERGLARPGHELMMRLSVALGVDASLRLFATDGPRLHDRFQAPMIEAVIRTLHDRWRPEVEVGVTDPARGVIDLVLTEPSGSTMIAGESCSRIERLEQELRWHGEKADGLARQRGRSSGVSRLLILRSTDHHRALATRYSATLAAAYPARTSDVAQALTTGAPWPGSGIVWMRVENGGATLLRHPPRGVTLGR